MELFALVERKPIMGNLSPLDPQGGLSLWLRSGIFALALLAAARPDRWAWSLPSLHDVFLCLFAYSILGDFAAGVLAVLVPIAIFVAAIVLLCFDRVVYVPAYRFARGRFQLSALAAFIAAVAFEGAVAGGLILAVRHHACSAEVSGAGRALKSGAPGKGWRDHGTL